MSALCDLFGKSKQAYYQYDEQRVMSRVAMRTFALEYAIDIRAIDPGIGIMKLWYMYQCKFRGERDILGRDQFSDLLVEHGMKVRLKIRKPRTTDSSHGLPIFSNLVTELIPTRPNQMWVSDITYIEIRDADTNTTFCYLSVVQDAYTRQIIGWSVGDTLATIHPLEALEMALRRLDGCDYIDLIHHSDRGVQYASSAYVNALTSRGIKISMTQNGNPKENPQAERINNTIKNELLKDMVFTSIEQVIAALEAKIPFYNSERPHMSLDMATPLQAESLTGEIHKRWHCYRDDAIHNKLTNSQEQPYDNY